MTRMPHFVHNTDIGQNFLIDRSVVDFMIGRANIACGDVVLEVGPGEGILTEGILTTNCSLLYTIEIDTRLKHGIDMIAIRDERLLSFWDDAVQFDYEKELPKAPTRVIANLPYHITTPLLWIFLEKLVPNGLEYMLLMVQLESAERIISKERNKARSPLGITMEAMGTSSILRNVSPTSFKPRPNVNSCIMEIKIEKNKELPLNKAWRELLKKSFTQRRKTLVNNWTSGYNSITRETALDILTKHGLSPSARAEELVLERWFDLVSEPVFAGKNIM